MRLRIEVLPRQAVDLGPAGDAGLDPVSHHVVRDLVLELVDESRALGSRADERHLSQEDVPELRKLVDRGAAQGKKPNRVRLGSSLVAQMGPVLDSASTRMERNLIIRNGRPSSPIRSCR